MKLWKKIYFCSLIIFLVTISLFGVILINKINCDLLKSEIDKQLEEQEVISSQIYIKYIVSNPSDYDNSKRLLEEYINNYMSSIDKRDGYVEILNEANTNVYSNLDFKLPIKRDELKSLSENKKNYIIRTLNKKQYLFISSLVNLNNFNFKITYIKDISKVYTQKNKYYNFFAYILIAISTIYTIFMFFFAKVITEPINKLMITTKKISQGEYSERVKIKCRDEFRSLANNFNLMADTVEDKINDLKESNLQKQSLINNITHELKTPLTSIIGYANLIKTSKYDEKIFFQASDYIYKEAKRMEQMTFKMMTLISLKSQSFDLKEEKIMDIVEEVRKSLFLKLKDKHIKLVIKGRDFTGSVDRELIKIMICNLVDNAIKASKFESKIGININKVEDNLKIQVIDNGIGIPKQKLWKIGEPFYVIDKSRSRKNNGAGIGFSICKRIAEIHNAKIIIESEVGKGTKVSVIFHNYFSSSIKI